MKAKIVILTDLHFSKSISSPASIRKCELADTLLLRAIHRLNRYINPDLVFIGGDLIDQPQSKDCLELLAELQKIINLIKAPTIVISGNHDPDKDIFESIMGKQPDFLDINGIRFVPFFDIEKPDYNAFRTNGELARMRILSAEFNGPLVSLQHVPLFPSKTVPCPYIYTNADNIIEVMRETNYVLALSGHFHHGFELLDYQGLNYIAGRALCEKLFGYAIIEIDDKGKVNCQQENLAMPEELRLVDYHVHTQLAYCNENMDIIKS